MFSMSMAIFSLLQQTKITRLLGVTPMRATIVVKSSLHSKNKLKKVLTNYSKRVIMIIENEREVFGMRIDVAMTCPLCGEDHAVEVNLAQYEAWQNGELIQNAMPYLTPTEREQLISGLCPKCQAKIFGE